MNYYISRVVEAGFDETLAKVVDALKQEGFGVLTEIDVSSTLKRKLGVDFRKYRILGACNPPLAHKALTAEDKIGVMLPCNVVVQEAGAGKTEVAAIDPRAAMERVGNLALAEIADQVAEKLGRVVRAV
ncbi:MAG TPA: DUF302 domain-containing protein [Roseiarcus sp.]|nr:DUF302 domain-containing protein [Roseiarcus sp.]